MIDIDFIRVKKVLIYLLTITLILLSGAVFKDFCVLLIVLALLFFIFTNRIYRAIELFFIWFFVFNFFSDQGYIINDYLLKYLAKPSFIIYLIFLFILHRIPKRVFNSYFTFIWLLFILVTVTGTILQGQSPLGILTWSSFFIIYYVLQAKGISIQQHKNLLNLFVAVALLQTMVSLLQLAQVIPPPSKMMDDGFGGQFKWVAGLDDVASGTFGAGAGHIASWYAALISLIMLLVWSITKKRVYIFLGGITFLQFATIDSKTILGVTILMLVYTLFYIARRRNLFRISIRKYLNILIFVGIGALIFYSAWDAYYHFYSQKTNSKQRVGISGVMENMVKETNTTVFEDISDWGKIKGFQYILNDFCENDISQIIWGYGLNGYSYNDKMSYIESLDTPAMKLNNFTRSRSGLIATFAKTGVIGFFLFGLSMFYWKFYNQHKVRCDFDALSTSLLKIFFMFSVLAAFLYSLTFNSITIISFAAISSILAALSKYDSTLFNKSI